MALIGISGKMQSGKNLTANIIQYLTSNDCSKQCLPRLRGGLDIQGYHNSEWQQKAFAGKLKQIVSILTGIPVEDLEKEEVKNSVLGEEWDTRFPYENSNIGDGEIQKYTLQLLLQKISTDAMRNVIHSNVWINALFAEYKREEILPEHDEPIASYIPRYKEPNWIITDMRFPNELEAIKQRGGITIRVNRYTGNVGIDNDTHVVTDWQHPSETALDNAEFDYVIDNSGSINDLIDKVRDIVKDL